MDAVERQLTLPTDLDEAWALAHPARGPGRLARRRGRARPHARGPPGLVVDPTAPAGTSSSTTSRGRATGTRRLAWRWWVEETDGGPAQPAGSSSRSSPRRRARGLTVTEQPEAPRGVVARASSGDGRPWPAPRPGPTACCASRPCCCSPPSSGVIRGRRPGPGGRRRVRGAGRPHAPGRAARGGRAGPGHRHRAGRPRPRHPPGHRQAPRACSRRPGLVTPSRAGRENRFTAVGGPARRRRALAPAPPGAAWDGRLARLADLAAGGDGPPTGDAPPPPADGG